MLNRLNIDTDINEIMALIDNKSNEDFARFLSEEAADSDIPFKLMSHGFLLIKRAMKAGARTILRLLLAFGADEGLTDDQLEQLCQMKVRDSKLTGLIKAANILEDINLQARFALRDNFFCRYVRNKHDWCMALYGLNTMDRCSKLLNTPEERRAYTCFLNNLAKIDLCSDEEYENFKGKQLFIVDYVTEYRAWYIITEDLSLEKIFKNHFDTRNNFMIWEEYQRFAEFRCFNKPVSLDNLLSNFDNDSNFCVLQLRYATGLNSNKFDFRNNRFIDEKSFKNLLKSPDLLSIKVNDCFTFRSFVKENKDKISIFMPVILKNEELFLRIFLGLNAPNKLPISMILSDLPEIEFYKKAIEQEALFWQEVIKNKNPIELFDAICLHVKESKDEFLLKRLLNHIGQLITKYQISKPLIENFDSVMLHICEARSQLDADDQQVLFVKMLDTFIEGMKKIEAQIKLPSLEMLSFYSVKKNNNPNELENYVFKSINEEEEKKIVFGK